MLELVISVCLLSEPTRCKDVHVTTMEDMIIPYHCAMQANVEVPKYIEAHPQYFARRWQCRPAKSFAEI